MTADPTHSIEELCKQLEQGIEPHEGIVVAEQLMDKAAAALCRQQAEIERLQMWGNEAVRQLEGWTKRAEQAEAEVADLRSRLGNSEYLIASYLEDIQDLREKANDMLAALKELLSGHNNLYVAHFGPDSDPHDDIAAKPARAAIAKAAGP